jgi:ADP-heptose:LPS heptosyltransferase
LRGFTDVAAVLSLLDLVVTIDGPIAHLAGALGRPVWILLPFQSDYRWMLNRDDSPWYPTATLFRQPAVGDWDSVIAAIRQAMAVHAF